MIHEYLGFNKSLHIASGHCIKLLGCNFVFKLMYEIIKQWMHYNQMQF